MIAVTGYSGFVGQHLLSVLDEKNCVLLGRKRINNKSKYCNFSLDFEDYTELGLALSSVSTLIHIAARVHIMNDDSQDPLTEFRQINTQGTLNLARQAASSGVKRFIFVSSIKVNGESTTNRARYKSSDEPAPQDPYGISKAEAEAGLKLIADETGMEVVIIRPPLVYGPGVKANFAAMLKLAATGIPLPFGCISQNKRSMVYVENLISLIVECINNPNAANQTFLVSDDNDLSTKEFVKGLSVGLGKSGLMLPVPNVLFSLAGKVLGKSAVIDRLCGSLQVDIDHTKETLNWQPPYTVEQGFAATAKHFKEQH
ncbi:UDP-glucose 4-epimerase [Colwellia sp. MT41]|uniref:UDP-glucose 4-epimerase family protein n=1 Tax=Colwellia sp. MT41 TaxID=58049 RepID=UPI00071760A7|nr:SDR family oxidoreductase [Colwellia sp. MT41]ALO33666.1 UDP-glucose 4-epimerase [Colwellia sp. MT41]